MNVLKVLQQVAILIILIFAAINVSAQRGQIKSFSKLVWADEFDYTGYPDTSKWQYEQGFVRGTESQLYTKQRIENAKVENGCLIITARKEKYSNPVFLKNKGSGKSTQYPSKYEGVLHDSIPPSVRNKFDSVAEYTSASLITIGKASWTYGKLEVKAKLPEGKGLWPAIWMMGINRSEVGWPQCGEIDVMEHVGKDPPHVYATVHYKDNQTGKRVKNGSKVKSNDLAKSFHIYSVKWDSTSIQFSFDDHVYHTFEIDQAGKGLDNPFRKPFYLLINLALGGSWGGPIDDAALPETFTIDYVRFYQ